MNRPRVLIADDHRLMAEGLKRLLAPHYELAGIVADGVELLAAAQRLRPDVAVVDITMPRLNGLDAIARLQEVHPAIRVVVITMHGEAAYARRALKAGAMGFVLKSSAPDELLTAIRAALAGRTFVTPEIEVELASPGGSSGKGKGTDGALTRRQTEILQLLAAGKTSKEIAAVLGISVRTVEFHKYKLMESLGLHTVAELVRHALDRGIATR